MTKTVEPAHARLTLSDGLAVLVGTGAGAGYAPRIPGTAGALVGLAVFLLLGSHAVGYWVLTAALAGAGFWAAGRLEGIYGHDSQRIVIDEVVGQMITLGYMAGDDAPGLALPILGFLLFRFLDILKPFPIRRLEQFPGGAGVMADDIGAGVCGLVSLMMLDALAGGFL